MAATWTIGLENGQMQTLADLNISDLKITFRNRAADEARFRIDGDYTTAGVDFVYGSTYKIAKNGTVVYRGRCEKIVRHGSGADQYANVVLLGGWHWLTLKFHQQSWPKGSSGERGNKSRVILGAKYNEATGENEMVSASAQLQDILSSAPAKVTRGAIAVSSCHIPLDERVDSTCAESVDAILSWWPDAVVYFRYESGTQINIKRLASLPPKTVPLASLAEEVEITARNDLCVPGVKLVYETIDENGCQNVHVDSKNAGDADAIGGVVNTISVGGSHQTWDIKSVKITSKSLPATLSASWWADRIPQLAGWSGVTLKQDGLSVKFADGSSASWPPRMGTKTLHSELLGGSVEPWMKEKVATVTVQQLADYTLNGQSYENAVLSIDLPLTSAETGIYQTGTITPPPEQYPAADGLAGEIHEATRKLYYEGSVVQIGEDPPELAAVGERLNLSGGAAEWSHMDTPVQTVEWDVARGQTRVSFGPPNQVGKQDQVARARANRTRGPARSCGVMGYSSTKDDQVSEGALGSVNTSVGGARPLKVSIGSADENATDSIVSDTTNSSAELVAKHGNNNKATVSAAENETKVAIESNGTAKMEAEVGNNSVKVEASSSEAKIKVSGGGLEASSSGVTLKVDPNASQEKFFVVTDITKLDFTIDQHGNHKAEIQIKKREITKISNCIYALGEETNDTLKPILDIDGLYAQDAGTELEVYADQKLQLKGMPFWSPIEDPAPLDEVGEGIEGEECSGGGDDEGGEGGGEGEA